MDITVIHISHKFCVPNLLWRRLSVIPVRWRNMHRMGSNHKPPSGRSAVVSPELLKPLMHMLSFWFNVQKPVSALHKSVNLMVM